MSFTCSVELIGGANECRDLIENHNIVTLVAQKGKTTDRFNATLEDLVSVDFFNTRIDEKTAYLRIKSFLAKKQH